MGETIKDVFNSFTEPVKTVEAVKIAKRPRGPDNLTWGIDRLSGLPPSSLNSGSI